MSGPVDDALQCLEGTEEGAIIRKLIDSVYSERTQLVCALSKQWPSYLGVHSKHDESWDDDWRWIVFIDSPEGQLSWHIHKRELDIFDHLPRRSGKHWDGHSTEEKYLRLARLK